MRVTFLAHIAINVCFTNHPTKLLTPTFLQHRSSRLSQLTMAPESSTQTDDAIASSSTAAPTRPPPTQPPPNNAQTQTQTGFQLYPGSYGQVFTPYQQQPANNGQQQPMFMGQQQWTPPPLVETKYWMVSKMGLHGTSMVCCVVGMGLAFSLIGQDEDDFMGLDVLGITSGPIVRLPTLSYSLFSYTNLYSSSLLLFAILSRSSRALCASSSPEFTLVSRSPSRSSFGS